MPGQLEELERAVLDDPGAELLGPEALVRVDVAHEQVHVTHADAELIALAELRKRRRGDRRRQHECRRESHRSSGQAPTYACYRDLPNSAPPSMTVAFVGP